MPAILDLLIAILIDPWLLGCGFLVLSIYLFSEITGPSGGPPSDRTRLPGDR